MRVVLDLFPHPLSCPHSSAS
uniref:Uncharacterized protein n=1 Tax=Arundo donax TaxID=35708 RepID=A0A0A8Z255_ARUDO